MADDSGKLFKIEIGGRLHTLMQCNSVGAVRMSRFIEQFAAPTQMRTDFEGDAQWWQAGEECPYAIAIGVELPSATIAPPGSRYRHFLLPMSTPRVMLLRFIPMGASADDAVATARLNTVPILLNHSLPDLRLTPAASSL